MYVFLFVNEVLYFFLRFCFFIFFSSKKKKTRNRNVWRWTSKQKTVTKQQDGVAWCSWWSSCFSVSVAFLFLSGIALEFQFVWQDAVPQLKSTLQITTKKARLGISFDRVKHRRISRALRLTTFFAQWCFLKRREKIRSVKSETYHQCSYLFLGIEDIFLGILLGRTNTFEEFIIEGIEVGRR